MYDNLLFFLNQKEVLSYAHQVCQILIQDLRTAFEPLWEAPANTAVLQDAFLHGNLLTYIFNIFDNIYSFIVLSFILKQARHCLLYTKKETSCALFTVNT